MQGYGSLSADKANDGNKSRNIWAGNSCSHTIAGLTTAWWQVDLQNTYVVRGVNITPREDPDGQYNNVCSLVLF